MRDRDWKAFVAACFEKSAGAERICGEGNWRDGVVSPYARAHRTICGGYRRPAMDSSGPGAGWPRVALWRDDCSWVFDALVDRAFCARGDADRGRPAAGGELWIESRAISRGGAGGITDSRARGLAGVQGNCGFGGGDL